MGRKITVPALPWIAIPTTAGTGAEATRNAVIGYPEKQFKASIRSELLLPRIALIDPEIARQCSAGRDGQHRAWTRCASSSSRTRRPAPMPMTDALALRGIALAARSLRRAVADGSDLDAREDMAMAALLSGIALTSAGLGAVHGFAAPLGANFPIPHGTVCAVLLPHVIEANARALHAQSAEHPTLGRYATVGRILAGNQNLSESAAIDQGIEATSALVRDLRISATQQFRSDRGRHPRARRPGTQGKQHAIQSDRSAG